MCGSRQGRTRRGEPCGAGEPAGSMTELREACPWGETVQQRWEGEPGGTLSKKTLPGTHPRRSCLPAPPRPPRTEFLVCKVLGMLVRLPGRGGI